MLFVGAGGLAAQLFEDLLEMKLPNVVFWTETVSNYDFIAENFRIISTDAEVKDYFSTVSKQFVVCVGKYPARVDIVSRFVKLGGEVSSFISPRCRISPFVKSIGIGTIILNDVVIEPGVTIGEQCLLNKQSNYGHGCTLSSFVQVAPLVVIAGESFIGERTMLGIGSIILERITIGKNVIISAGSVVTKNIPDYAVVSGVPGKVRFIKEP